MHIFKRMLKAMDEIGNLIQSLAQAGIDPVLAKLNMEGLSRVQNPTLNGAPTENSGLGPTIDDIIRQSSDNANASTGVAVPKTQGLLSSQGAANPYAADQAKLDQLLQTVPQPKINTQPANVKKPSLVPFTGDITPSVIDSYTTKFGVPDPKITEAILRAAKTTGTDANLLFQFANVESKFKPNATPIIYDKKGKPVIDPKTGKPKVASSAKGLYQFLDSTWNEVMHKKGAKANYNLKGNPFDPYESAVATSVYLNDIKKSLSQVGEGRDYTFGEYYLGHFAGPGGAQKALRAIADGKGNLPANTFVDGKPVFNQKQIESNPSIFYQGTGKDRKLRTIENVIKHLDGKVAMKEDKTQGEA